jgi:hypothetical protein
MFSIFSWRILTFCPLLDLSWKWYRYAHYEFIGLHLANMITTLLVIYICLVFFHIIIIFIFMFSRTVILDPHASEEWTVAINIRDHCSFILLWPCIHPFPVNRDVQWQLPRSLEIDGQWQCIHVDISVPLSAYDKRNGREGVDNDGNAGPERPDPDKKRMPATVYCEEIGWRELKVVYVCFEYQP